jgi:hypothetical protein
MLSTTTVIIFIVLLVFFGPSDKLLLGVKALQSFTILQREKMVRACSPFFFFLDGNKKD